MASSLLNSEASPLCKGIDDLDELIFIIKKKGSAFSSWKSIVFVCASGIAASIHRFAFY